MGLLAFPVAVTIAVLTGSLAWGGMHALFLVALLAVLEVTLSFDNAVVNAKVLERMPPRWQNRFLTWGILIAVFGTRFLFPVIIVALAAGLSPLFVAKLAVFDAPSYALYLSGAHEAIASFGSAFLFLVSLKYFFNERKTVHWIDIIERYLSRWGGIEAIEIALVLLVLLGCSMLAPLHAATILTAGLVGVILFIFTQGVAQSFEIQGEVTGGLALFAYLNVLDSAFSLDGVVGAFAVTNSLPVIVAGLGIGALYVRTFTIMLVRSHTLSSFRYIEHGAHYAILGLAIAMLVNVFVELPEAVTGLVGLVFIVLSYISSRRAMQA